MVANILSIDPLNEPLGSGKRSKKSEHGYVAYHIKGNDEYSNMQAHILSLFTHILDPWGWVKGQNFSM